MDEKVPRSNIIETEIPMGTVHPAALEPYRVRLKRQMHLQKKFVESVPIHIYGIHAEPLKLV